MTTIDVLGIDLGASNGRGVIGSFDGNRLTLREAHRFTNGPVAIMKHLYWDIAHLYKETLQCIRAAETMSGNVAAIGIDGWSQDFGILDRNGNLLGLPHHYRDPRTDNVPAQIFEAMSPGELFTITGKMPSRVCTLFQLGRHAGTGTSCLGERTPSAVHAEFARLLPDRRNKLRRDACLGIGTL